MVRVKSAKIFKIGFCVIKGLDLTIPRHLLYHFAKGVKLEEQIEVRFSGSKT